MSDTYKTHLERLRKAVFDSYSLVDIPRWIVDNTRLNDDKFNFHNHEFQLTIASDTAQVLNVQKCAQIGMSELMARYAVAACKIIPNFSVILTFPYSGDAENFSKTRISPIIESSPLLKDSISGEINNAEIKGIDSSLLYIRGCAGNTQALSTPADMLIHDELDKSDPATVGQYQSRIRHSKWKLVRKFSTPTLAKRGISAEMDVSRRMRNMCKCNHCNEYFVPDYFDHVKIPGYSGDMREITKDTIRNIKWREAVLICPGCGKVPSLQVDRREWVVENGNDNYEAKGYFCSPFDVPNMMSVADLVLESTKYERYSEFENQALGLVANNTNDQITEGDILDTRLAAPLDSSNLHCMGADMGLICHITIGRMTLEGMLLVVHRERVPLSQFETRKQELAAKYRCLVNVCDSQPYVDLILKMQGYDPNLYGAVYSNSKALTEYTVKDAEEDEMLGKLPIKQVIVNRDTVFDKIMRLFKERKVVWQAQDKEADEVFQAHLLDMKREQKMDRNYELVYTWTKSAQAADHYHHALLYLYIACKLFPTASREISLQHVPLLTKFRVRQGS